MSIREHVLTLIGWYHSIWLQRKQMSLCRAVSPEPEGPAVRYGALWGAVEEDFRPMDGRCAYHHKIRQRIAVFPAEL